MNQTEKLGPVPNLFARFTRHVEAPVPAYSGRGEVALAMLILPLTFLYKVLDCLYGKNAIPGQPWPYILLLSIFTALAFSSVFWLATRPGANWIVRMLKPDKRQWLIFLPAMFSGSFILVVWWLGLPEFSTHVLPMRTEPWADLSYPVFLCVAALLLSGGFWVGLSLADKVAWLRQSTSQFIPFGWRDLGCVGLAVLPFLVLQEQLPILWCFTTPVAVIVMVFASGLGREHFCFSFVPRSWRETGFILLLMVSGLLLFLLVSLGAGTISYSGGLWRSNWTVVYDSVFTWLLIVGISEEIIFRCGILTLIGGLLARKQRMGWWKQHPRLGAVLLTSLLFALAHLFRGATLIFLALLASLLYGLAFVAGKSLFGPVLLHGLLNVLVLMNFHLSDFK